ncbi:DUF6985 domain-containing protein [Bacillus bingmayongensis]
METTNKLLEHIALAGIYVTYATIREDQEIGLSFACSWEDVIYGSTKSSSATDVLMELYK